MKNTELAKVKGIMKYKEELNKVKPLEKNEYTVKEAAEYFRCTSSQIKGYHSNYKEIFGDTVKVIGTPGKQKTIISKDAMFLLALLLGKKSKVAEEVVNAVMDKLEKNAPKQIAMEEIAATETAEKKVKTDNVIDFNEIKEKIESGQIKSKKDKEEMIEVPSIELTEDGPKLVMKKISKKEHEERRKEVKETLSKIFSEIENSIEEAAEEECNCPECLEEDFNISMHVSKTALLEAKTTLAMQLEITKSYKEICSLLDIDSLDASIMIQSYIANGEGDLDNTIFNYLVDTKRKDEQRKVGSLLYAMELLTTEKFNDSKEDAYINFANELKYIIGTDLTELVVNHEYEKLLTQVVREKAYDDAQGIIFTLLAE